jgi:hypothetical protein
MALTSWGLVLISRVRLVNVLIGAKIRFRILWTQTVQ